VGFPWRKLLTFGLAGAAIANPGIGAILSRLIHVAEDAIKGSGKGAEKAEKVVNELLDGLKTEGLDPVEIEKVRDAAHNAVDAIVTLENLVASLKALKH
jgi:hypothetical protein